jgi:hypothetical protein
MKLPCTIEQLAQSFMDAQSLLDDLHRRFDITPDHYQCERQQLKTDLIQQNPGLFPVKFPAH